MQFQKLDNYLAQLEETHNVSILRRIFFRFVLIPVIILYVFFYSLFWIFFELIKKYFLRIHDTPLGVACDLDDSSTFAEFDSLIEWGSNDDFHHAETSRGEIASKYLYSSNLILVEEKEEPCYKTELEISRKNYEKDRIMREAKSNGEAIGSMVTAQIAVARQEKLSPCLSSPKPTSPLQTKLKDRRRVDEKSSKPCDIEELKKKLLTPKESSLAMVMEMKKMPPPTDVQSSN